MECIGVFLSCQYGAESWEALLFLGCVAAVLLGPAAWFALKVRTPCLRSCLFRVKSTREELMCG